MKGGWKRRIIAWQWMTSTAAESRDSIKRALHSREFFLVVDRRRVPPIEISGRPAGSVSLTLFLNPVRDSTNIGTTASSANAFGPARWLSHIPAVSQTVCQEIKDEKEGWWRPVPKERKWKRNVVLTGEGGGKKKKSGCDDWRNSLLLTWRKWDEFRL